MNSVKASEQMPMSRRAMAARLMAVFVALWAVAALLEPGHPKSIAIAPVAPICFGLSSLWRGDIEVAIVSLAVSLFVVAMTVFSIARRRALWAAVSNPVQSTQHREGAMTPSDKTASSRWDPSATRGVARFRAVLAVVGYLGAAWQFVIGFAYISHGCMDRFGGEIAVYLFAVPLLVIAATSTGIAIALFRKSVPGIAFALVFDAIMLMGVMGVVAMCLSEFYDVISPLGERVMFGLIAMAVALPFGVEAAWLLSACRGWRRAWLWMGLFMLVLLSAVVIGPLVAYCLPAR